MALEQQREVVAVPGNITSKMSWGPNLLIKQGGKLVQEWNDVLAELPAETRRALIAKAQARFGQIPLEIQDEKPTFADEIRSEEHTSELQSRQYLVCRLLLEKKKTREVRVLAVRTRPQY